MNDRELMIQTLKNVLQYDDAKRDRNYDKEMLTRKWERTIEGVKYVLDNTSEYTLFQKVTSRIVVILCALAFVVVLTWFIVHVVSNIVRTIINV